MSHARPIEPAATTMRALVNFVQRIINQLEDGDTKFALLTAVDLRDRLELRPSPFSHVIPPEALAIDRIAMHNAVNDAYERGRNDGATAAKRAIARQLGLLAEQDD